MTSRNNISLTYNKNLIILNSCNISEINFCGIYFLIENNKIVYVGQTKNGYFRIFEHIKTKSFEKFSIFVCEECLLDYYENYFIMNFKPKLNKVIPKYGYYISFKFLNKLLYNRGLKITLKKLENLIQDLKLEKFYFANELFIKRKNIKTLVKEILKRRENARQNFQD